MASKIAVIGNVDGQFPAVFEKLAALHSKLDFAFALVVGNLFAHPAIATEEDNANVQALLEGNIKAPLPIYFALARSPFPPAIVNELDNSMTDDVGENLHFLGKRSVMKTSEGIRIVTLGGELDPNIVAGQSTGKYLPYYNDTDAKILRGATKADILITNEWPAGIRTRSTIQFKGDQEPQGQECLADLCAVLKPTYHFSTSGDTFYEREPFFFAPTEDSEGLYPVTRFISLASYGNPTKQKWIYAFSLDPTASNPVAAPVGATASPISLSDRKRSAPGTRESNLVYEDNHRGPRPTKRRRGANRGPLAIEDCFFCLSNQGIAAHLIAIYGDSSYITTAKGPLPTSTTYPQLGFPCHMLIIPYPHNATLAQIPGEDRLAAYTEMQRFRSSMNSMLKARAGDDLGSVTWEVSKSSIPHTHWQYLPVNTDLIRKGLVEAGFRVLAENNHWPAFKKKDVGIGLEEASDFFRFMVWDPKDPEEQYTSYILRFDENIKFHNQFGREVLAKLMRLDDRVDWHSCGQTQEQEEEDVEKFQVAFKEFDFTESNKEPEEESEEESDGKPDQSASQVAEQV